MQIVQVCDEFSWQSSFAENPTGFLKLVRKAVRKASASPELNGYTLHDIGLGRQNGKLQVNLYYRHLGNESSSA